MSSSGQALARFSFGKGRRYGDSARLGVGAWGWTKRPGTEQLPPPDTMNARSQPEPITNLRVGGVDYRVRRADANALLDDLIANGGEERHIPYWADLWPGASGIVARIHRLPELVAGRVVLDLGCGLGFAGIAAAKLGAKKVYLGDHMPEAVERAVENARLNDVGDLCEGRQFDWRVNHPPVGTEVILAADVLYDLNEHPFLAELFAERVGPEVDILVGDPGRKPTPKFFAKPRLASMAFEMTIEKCEFDGKPRDVQIYHRPGRRADAA
jgi:predicted nicotinamide N-methyase